LQLFLVLTLTQLYLEILAKRKVTRLKLFFLEAFIQERQDFQNLLFRIIRERGKALLHLNLGRKVLSDQGLMDGNLVLFG